MRQKRSNHSPSAEIPAAAPSRPEVIEEISGAAALYPVSADHRSLRSLIPQLRIPETQSALKRLFPKPFSEIELHFAQRGKPGARIESGRLIISIQSSRDLASILAEPEAKAAPQRTPEELLVDACLPAMLHFLERGKRVAVLREHLQPIISRISVIPEGPLFRQAMRSMSERSKESLYSPEIQLEQLKSAFAERDLTTSEQAELISFAQVFCRTGTGEAVQKLSRANLSALNKSCDRLLSCPSNEIDAELDRAWRTLGTLLACSLMTPEAVAASVNDRALNGAEALHSAATRRLLFDLLEGVRRVDQTSTNGTVQIAEQQIIGGRRAYLFECLQTLRPEGSDRVVPGSGRSWHNLVRDLRSHAESTATITPVQKSPRESLKDLEPLLPEAVAWFRNPANAESQDVPDAVADLARGICLIARSNGEAGWSEFSEIFGDLLPLENTPSEPYGAHLLLCYLSDYRSFRTVHDPFDGSHTPKIRHLVMRESAFLVVQKLFNVTRREICDQGDEAPLEQVRDTLRRLEKLGALYSDEAFEDPSISEAVETLLAPPRLIVAARSITELQGREGLDSLASHLHTIAAADPLIQFENYAGLSELRARAIAAGETGIEKLLERAGGASAAGDFADAMSSLSFAHASLSALPELGRARERTEARSEEYFAVLEDYWRMEGREPIEALASVLQQRKKNRNLRTPLLPEERAIISVVVSAHELLESIERGWAARSATDAALERYRAFLDSCSQLYRVALNSWSEVPGGLEAFARR